MLIIVEILFLLLFSLRQLHADKMEKCRSTQISVSVKEIEAVQIDPENSNMAHPIAHSVALELQNPLSD